MKFMQRSLIGLFLLALTFGLLATAGGSVYRTLQASWSEEKKQRPARERVFAVNIVTAQRVTASPVITAFGEVRSRRTLDLRASGSGTVVFLSDRFVEGGVVAKGEVLLRLDPADAQSASDVAMTELSEARSELSEATAALVLAKDELAAARAQEVLRKAALARQENLLERGVGLEANVENAALAQSAAVQAVLGKRQALAQAEARINRANSQLARRDIKLAEAARNLKNTELIAEFDGALSGITVVVGGLVGTNEKLGRLIDPLLLEADFRVSNSQFARLVAGDNTLAETGVTILLELLGQDVSASGKIQRSSAEVAEGQTGRRLFASLPRDRAEVFRPGDFVTVNISEPALQNVAILPASAVNSSGIVLVLGEENRLEEIQLTVLRRQGDTVIVRGAGLFGRDVVEARSPLLGAGIKVKPVRRGAVVPTEPDMVELTPERRARLIAFVEGNERLPQAAKDRMLERLSQPKAPAQMVARIEARMGG